MNKTELVAAVAAKTELSKKDAEKALSAVLETVSETLAAGEKVQLVGFGTFETKERSERTAKNPRTGETVTVPASRVPGFKAGQGRKVISERLQLRTEAAVYFIGKNLPKNLVRKKDLCYNRSAEKVLKDFEEII